MKRNVIIFGASKGIGRAASLEFAKSKDNLVLVARSLDLLNSLKDNCLKLGANKVEIVNTDLLNINLKEFSKNLLSKYGSFDVVVHSVGSSLTSRDVFGGEESWLDALRLNALHAIDINSILIPDMIQKGIKGRVIHVSSISALMLRGNSLYASSKAFLNAYVTTTGREIASKGICLNSVMPGAISFDNSYWDNKVKSNDPAVKEFLNQHQAINRFGTPEEVAKLIHFLAEPTSSFFCGENIPIDGGNM